MRAAGGDPDRVGRSLVGGGRCVCAGVPVAGWYVCGHGHWRGPDRVAARESDGGRVPGAAGGRWGVRAGVGIVRVWALWAGTQASGLLAAV